jgi:L-fuconolactonase
MPYTLEMIAASPGTQFILDHLGKPRISAGAWEEYKYNIKKLSAFPNVAAKLSGLLTEADHQSWTAGELAPYIQYAVDRFGEDRLLFGSDWPVITLAGSCRQWVDALLDGLQQYGTTTIHKIFYKNAMKFYRL